MTVLLVDDEAIIIEVGQAMLKHLGYEVLVAHSGREAIDKYQPNQDKIDVVLLDMWMPEMDGVEAFGRLKAINPGVRVILMSGYSVEDKASALIEGGAEDFLQKPFDFNQLDQTLKGVL